ncbi:hypothetical protein OCS_02243 [Ophiocordyceps sinensis CO18]|uniref:GPI anchored serine-threonine rich protein n=1 Tax=Ophiocordyceps sinensis (strain Co18 / CGMCC 3.14243) TaxID=911162 RepID=T5AJP1_OPHSC|nr:hypothetical protein OCS_02243 [Ophiocordyceps sinensis CO18]
MKFLIPLTLLVAAVVSAQDQDCLADYIVQDCKPNDYDCLCAAYESVATCYNNCPNDTRAPDARHQVTNFCQNASLYGTRARAAKTSASAASQSTASNSNAAMTTADSSATAASASTTATSTSRSSSTGAAEVLSANAGGLLVAIVGAVAALL